MTDYSLPACETHCMLKLILAAVGGVALLWRDSHYWNNFKSETNYFGPVQLRTGS